MSEQRVKDKLTVLEWFALPALGSETKSALDARLAVEREGWEKEGDGKTKNFGERKRFTEKERGRLAMMVIRLFDHWSLTSSERCLLLGLPPTGRVMLNRYRKGMALEDNPDLIARVGHLLGIHKNLRIIFPENQDLAYQWVKAPNQRFDGKPPLEIMCQGEGLLAVRHYLDFELVIQ